MLSVDLKVVFFILIESKFFCDSKLINSLKFLGRKHSGLIFLHGKNSGHKILDEKELF